MSTPRDEVLRSQQLSAGLKPDRTTTPPPAAKAPARPTNPERLNIQKPLLPNPATPTPAQRADPTFMAGVSARTADVAMYNKQRVLENAAPGRQTGVGTMVQPRIGGNGRDPAALRGMPAPPVAPVASAVPAVAAVAQQPAPQQAPGYGVLAPVAPVVQPQQVQPQANSQRQVVPTNTYTDKNGVAQPVVIDESLKNPAQVAAQPNYAMPQQYNGPVPQRPNSADIAGGMSREEIIKKIEAIGNDSNARLSPTLMRSMAEPYVAMLGDKDKAELNREQGGLDIQQAAVQGQAQGAVEMQRGQQRRAENIYAQQGAETLKTMDQNAPTELTDSTGKTFLRRGVNAEVVKGPDGKPIVQSKKGEGVGNDNKQLEVLRDMAKAEQENKMLNPDAPTPYSDALAQQILPDAQAQGAPADGAIAYNPKTKERMRYNAKTGQMEPIK